MVVIVIWLCVFFQAAVAVCNNNGVVDSGEQCDDGNTRSGDGCYNDCTLEPVFLDFNTSSSQEHTIEFYDIDEVVFFANADAFNLVFTPSNLSLGRIILLMLGDPLPVRDNLEIFTTEAYAEGRLPQDYGPFFITSPLLPPNDPRLNISTYIDNGLVTVAEEIRGSSTSSIFGGDGDDLISLDEARILLLAAGYQVGVHPGFSPRYRIMEATATLHDFAPGSLEFLSLNLLSGFNSNYSEGVLRVEGEGTAEQYSQMLSTLQYFNNLTESIAGTSKMIAVAVFDGIFTSYPEFVELTITSNGTPSIYLTGPSPIVTNSSVSYVEGSGQVEVVPRLVVVDTDPQAIIQRVIVSLANPLDGAEELLGVVNTTFPGIAIISSSTEVSFTGAASVAQYTTAVRRTTYWHRDAQPGNPSIDQPRMLEFFVENADGVSNLQNSTLFISIIPINDPPILSLVFDESLRSSPQPFLSIGNSTSEYEYTQGDSAVNFGKDIYLRDVDSNNIGSASLYLTDLINDVSDVVEVNGSLMTAYGVNITNTIVEKNEGQTRDVYFVGEASPQTYEEILRSLTYRNLLTANQVVNGTRTVIITVNDTEQLSSQMIIISIDVVHSNTTEAPTTTNNDTPEDMPMYVVAAVAVIVAVLLFILCGSFLLGRHYCHQRHHEPSLKNKAMAMKVNLVCTPVTPPAEKSHNNIIETQITGQPQDNIETQLTEQLQDITETQITDQPQDQVIDQVHNEKTKCEESASTAEPPPQNDADVLPETTFSRQASEVLRFLIM